MGKNNSMKVVPSLVDKKNSNPRRKKTTISSYLSIKQYFLLVCLSIAQLVEHLTVVV